MNLLFVCTFYFFHLIWMELFSVITTLFQPFNFLPRCILCNCKKAASDIFRCIILWIGVKCAIKIYFAQHSLSEDSRLQSIQFIKILTWNAVSNVSQAHKSVRPLTDPPTTKGHSSAPAPLQHNVRLCLASVYHWIRHKLLNLFKWDFAQSGLIT